MGFFRSCGPIKLLVIGTTSNKFHSIQEGQEREREREGGQGVPTVWARLKSCPELSLFF